MLYVCIHVAVPQLSPAAVPEVRPRSDVRFSLGEARTTCACTGCTTPLSEGQGCGLHVRSLRLSMHKDVHANALLLLDGVCHVLVDLLLVVSITQLTLLVCQTCTPDGCITEHRGVKYQVLRIFTKDKRSRCRQSLTSHCCKRYIHSQHRLWERHTHRS